MAEEECQRGTSCQDEPAAAAPPPAGLRLPAEAAERGQQADPDQQEEG